MSAECKLSEAQGEMGVKEKNREQIICRGFLKKGKGLMMSVSMMSGTMMSGMAALRPGIGNRGNCPVMAHLILAVITDTIIILIIETCAMGIAIVADAISIGIDKIAMGMGS